MKSLYRPPFYSWQPKSRFVGTVFPTSIASNQGLILSRSV
uniref:Uncharacterized protein n=1 Tax=Arundo donax TaxID=35708 RepID=A0A0A9BTA2_ARUDO